MGNDVKKEAVSDEHDEQLKELLETTLSIT